MGVCWRQDEHPLSKGVLEGEDESSGVTQEECQDKENICKLCNEPGVPISQNLRSTIIAKHVTAIFANTKL